MDPSGNSAGGETPPSSQNQTHVTANNESHIINEPSPPLHNAGGSTAPPSRPRPLAIEEPRQPPLGANQESHIINQQIPPQHHAANGRGAQPSPSSQRQLEIQEQDLKDQILLLQQYLLRVNQESHTIKKPSPSLYSAGQRTFSQAWKNKLLQQELKDQLLQNQHALKVHQESHSMKKPSSSSEDRRGGVVARSCANCNNTSTTQWRGDPTGQKSLCNACGIRFNRDEKTRAASGLQSSNISSAALRRSLEEERDRVEPMENNANPFVPENDFLRHSSGLQSSNVLSPPPAMSPPAAPSLANSVQFVENVLLGYPPAAQLHDPSELASKMEELRQSLTDRTPENNPFVPENNLGLQSSPPLRDSPEEASETEVFWQSWINKTLDNSPGA